MKLFARFILLSVSMLYAINSEAQICTGSLGDPVVNITFGSGANPGPSLSGRNTTYQKSNDLCPGDGYYNIVNRSDNCFGNSWHILREDHTPGDANGYMMLVNASYTPGVFYVETVRGLCANTTYEFAAWIANVMLSGACGNGGIQPNITFTITTPDGKLLAPAYNTGNIPVSPFPNWKQYGLFFTTTAVTDVVITITNNAPGGCGNDLVLDDITFRACGPTVSTDIAGIDNETQAEMCADESRSFIFNSTISSGYNNPAYQWQQSVDNSVWINIQGATTTTLKRDFNAPLPGVYRYRMATSEAANINSTSCRIFADVITINVNALPNAKAENNGPVCENAMLLLTASGGATYRWTGPDGFISTEQNVSFPQAGLQQAGEYTVIVTSADNCVNSASTIVVVNKLPVAVVSAKELAICAGSSIGLQASGGIRYKWLPAIGLSNAEVATPLASPIGTTTYRVTVTNAAGCTDVDTVLVRVIPVPVADAGADVKIFEGQAVKLGSGYSDNKVSYFWTPALYLNNADVLNPIATPPEDMTYTLHAVPENGCSVVTDEIFVRVFHKIVIPNSFSPNGDGINDIWNIEALETYPESKLEIYNRNGQRLYQSNGYNKPWDGKFKGQILPVGTYYYIIDLKNGTSKLAGSLFLVQ
ncbi:MAG: gliding motility-associated C-terminal domain-containing protein [Sphingobacteriaceae bacterium]